MFSHITLGTNDIDRARRFYEPVMETLGIAQPFNLPETLVFGEMVGTKLFIVSPFDGGAASIGNGTHAAFLASDRAAVDAFHAAALAKTAAATRVRPACGRIITPIITAPMSAIPTATSCRPFATARPTRVDHPRRFA